MLYHYPVYLSLLCFLTCAACHRRVPKLIENGHYERAYRLALYHGTRASAQPPKQRNDRQQRRLRQYREAYLALQQHDYRRVDAIHHAGHPHRWPQLYTLYGRMLARSQEATELLPDSLAIIGPSDLLPAGLNGRREDARRRSGEYYLALAAPDLPAARSGEKPAARSAYQHVGTALEYLPERNQELASLLDTLTDIGTLRIYLYVPDGEKFATLSAGLLSYGDWAKGWTVVRTLPSNRTADLEGEITYTGYENSGETVDVDTETFSEEVLDRIEHKEVKVRVNDSTEVTRTVEVKHYKTVYATVTTVEQRKELTAFGQVSVFAPGGRFAVWTHEVSATSSWRNEYSDGSGDRRAMPSFACSGMRMSAPSDASMLDDAVGNLPGRGRSAVIRRYHVRVDK